MRRLVAEIRRTLGRVERVPMPEDLGPAPRPAPPELAARFARALERASGRVVRLRDEDEARAWIAGETKGRRVDLSAGAPGEDDLRAADVGVDRADLLVADTGTIVRSYSSREAARVSLLPPVTVFLGSVERIVPDLADALRRLEARHGAGRAYTLLATGPSRTADIEKRLVIPAHGPREVVVLLLEQQPRGTRPA